MFQLRKELDTTELIKWGAAVLGGVVVFLVISLNEIENDNTRLSLELAKAKKEAVEEVTAYRPRLRIHYTNMASEDNAVINVRVFMELTSSIELQLSPPVLTLFDKKHQAIDASNYEAIGLSSYQGLFSPDSILNIEYKIRLLGIDATDVGDIRLEYTITSDSFTAAISQNYLATFKDEDINRWAQNAATKVFSYQEPIYPHGQNEIWKNFWERVK